MRTTPALVLGALVLAACSDSPVMPGTNTPESTASQGSDTEPWSIAGHQRGVAGITAFERQHFADGYAWADNPTSASYAPSGFYAFNRIRGAMQITKPAGTTGRYLVRFNDLSRFVGGTSTVHVTGYSTDDTWCKPATPTLVGDVLDVRCFDESTNAAANAYYAVFVTRNYPDLAYAHANQPAGTNYAPPANASWNPSGAIRVFRNGTGNYTVRFSGLGSLTAANGGHAQVSIVGTGSAHCNVGGWGGSPDLDVNVLCWGGAALPVDTKFNVQFFLPSPYLAYAWADQPSAASYTPSAYYSSNPNGGAITITRTGVGTYGVSWSGLSLLDGGDVQVTAYGVSTGFCKVAGWGSSSASIRCFNSSGVLSDMYYTVMLAS